MTGARGRHLENVKLLYAILCAAALSACTATTYSVGHNFLHPPTTASLHCSARDASSAVQWRIGDASDSAQLARWCRAVGAPLLVTAPSITAEHPALDELVAISWNAHLAAGELPELIAKLKSGALTNGKPVTHFVLLVQELYRRGDAVPAFDAGDRTAFAIKDDPTFPDIDDYARHLGALGRRRNGVSPRA